MPKSRLRYFLVLVFISSMFSHATESANGFVTFSGSYRLRFETLDNTFRANRLGGDQAFTSRLLLKMDLDYQSWNAAIEMMDSRTWLDDEGSPLGTDDVNVLEPLQAYVTLDDIVKVGWQTLNLGSRRLVSRNNFRNTINSFAGITATVVVNDWTVTPLALMPVQRRPADRQSLDNNDAELDRVYTDTYIFGGLSRYENDEKSALLEFYALGFSEQDEPALASRNRDISTVGMRIRRALADPSWRYEVEAAYQWGKSRASSASADTVDLDHQAFFLHAGLARDVADKWPSHISKIRMFADYASGDKDPDDLENNRFDTLFGSRGFEFGATGIYGPFSRSNIASPGLRLEFETNNVSAFLTYRAIWLASDRDALTTANVVDFSGDTDSFVAQQLETRVRVSVSKQIRMDIGGAYLLKEAFLTRAPNHGETANTRYFYAELVYSF